MKGEISIGIVEDELLIAEKINMILSEIGYTVFEPATNYQEAIQLLESEKPDLLILDINLEEEKDGIDIARQVNSTYALPFIFLTANSDRSTIERAKTVRPYAFLVKPFTKEELFTAIEIAVNNFNTYRIVAETAPKLPNNNCLFIRDNHRFIKVVFSDISFIESRENYVVIHTVEKKQLLHRSTFSDFLAQLPAGLFMRVHRSFAVQTNLIEQVEQSMVCVAGVEVPVSNSYRDNLFAYLRIK